jgi:hypothetical protein
VVLAKDGSELQNDEDFVLGWLSRRVVPFSPCSASSASDLIKAL